LLLAENLEKESIVKGLFLGTYEYPFSQNHLFFNDDFSLEFEDFTENISKNTLSLCNGQFAAMDWLNKPANYKKVPQISEFLKNISEKYGLKYSCFDRKNAKNWV
jgi:leucyl aminopeptidase